jgi:hypothetical protein
MGVSIRFAPNVSQVWTRSDGIARPTATTPRLPGDGLERRRDRTRDSVEARRSGGITGT